MEYEWDSNKAQSNIQKHGIDFADAVSVFSDALGRIIVVVYTWRGDSCIWLISARKATKRERLLYELEE
ncbi:conserved hypothetical protein [Calothrix sp. PCC 7716]|nr:conserved hypothetical protein [Calothrix sp. PCC 7716]